MQPQHLDDGGLRLDRDHAGAEPAKGRDAVAHMGADIEHEVAAFDELRDRAGPWRARRLRSE